MPLTEHIGVQDCELYLTGRLSMGEALVVENHLVECGVCLLKLSAAEDCFCQLERLSANETVRDGREKRREPRIITNDPALLQILIPFSDEHLDVVILDASKSGLRLLLPTAVMPGSHVQVRMKDSIAFGNAKYCAPATEGFYIGVQLSDHVILNPLTPAKEIAE